MSGRKLGRGLDMLIGRRQSIEPQPPAESAPTEGSGRAAPLHVVEVDPATVQANPEQPRKLFNKKDLQSLKTSISQEGLLQPILVRQIGDGFQLIAGERRLRAAQELKLAHIPAIVCALTQERLLEIALIENLQRQDLNPIEVAEAYEQLLHTKEWTQEVLAKALGLSRSSVANTLRLLDLPKQMQQSLAAAQISMGHAKVLLSVEDPDAQKELFERIAENRLSVRELEDAREEVAIRDPEKSSRPPRKTPKKEPQLLQLEQELGRLLGTKVVIQQSKSGRGRVTIEFYSADDFDRLRDTLGGKP